jgi:hypothetical protein
MTFIKKDAVESIINMVDLDTGEIDMTRLEYAFGQEFGAQLAKEIFRPLEWIPPQ